ncbi:hypothetical protein EDD64_11453 [Effusibacillus lacus]|nr:hypothetical protein EDD64_11453 [Effusibacillus lacus]
MCNAILLKEGYAKLMTIPPNVKYVDLFVKLQRQARKENKDSGRWAFIRILQQTPAMCFWMGRHRRIKDNKGA